MVFKYILDNLNKQIEIYSKIYDLTVLQQEIIISCNSKELMNNIEDIKALFNEAKKVEQERLDFIKDEKFVMQDAPLNDIILKCNDKIIKEKLAQAKLELTSIFEKQKDLNKVVSNLLEINLKYFDYMLNSYAQGTSPNNLYSSNGYEEIQQSSYMGILNSEV